MLCGYDEDEGTHNGGLIHIMEIRGHKKKICKPCRPLPPDVARPLARLSPSKNDESEKVSICRWALKYVIWICRFYSKEQNPSCLEVPAEGATGRALVSPL